MTTNVPTAPTWPAVSATREKELKAMPYRAYLLTPEWGARRLVMLHQAGYRCQVCNRSGIIHVHHRTYARRGAELQADLIVLCDGCHALYHGKGRISEPAVRQPARKPVSPRRVRAPKRERDAFNASRGAAPSWQKMELMARERLADETGVREHAVGWAEITTLVRLWVQDGIL